MCSPSLSPDGPSLSFLMVELLQDNFWATEVSSRTNSARSFFKKSNWSFRNSAVDRNGETRAHLFECDNNCINVICVVTACSPVMERLGQFALILLNIFSFRAS